ncbi:MAG: DUF3293 domain-containing protein [Acidobacteria bacterium]|nr:DUF3293 domain-containing protein [Acidobacteriota bacterium]
MTSPDADLIAAYRRTDYRVDDGGYAFVLRVDTPSAALVACHGAFGVTCSAFITAWNPRSEPTPRARNEAAMAALERTLSAGGWRWLRGAGVDPSGAWPPEPSLLVLGLDASTAVAIAQRCAQHAIVCAAVDGVPTLVLVDS